LENLRQILENIEFASGEYERIPMGVELQAPVQVNETDRYKQGLKYPNPLAGNPARKPEFAETVRRKDGSTLDVASPRATRLMVALMNTHAVFGGAASHWGGPSAFAEIMSSVHALMFNAADWRTAYNFVNDAGHTENGIYALKANYGFAGLTLEDLKGFRSIRSKLTGHGESHLFAEGVMVSNGPLGSAPGIAQGLAMADALANQNRLTYCTISDGGMMEGEAREAVAAIPGLAAKGLLAPFVLVLSDNNTKLSGRIDADSFSMQPSFESLDDLGWRVIRVENGHDLQAVFSAVEQADELAKADATKPVAVWVKTVKGFGVAATEKSASGGHGFPVSKGDEIRQFCEEINGGPLPPVFETWVKEIETLWAAKQAKASGAAPAAPAVKKDKIQAGFPKAMIRTAEKGLPVVSVSADLQGSTGVNPFRAKFPQLSFEVGIAEANMISAAAGFSKQGFIPVVDTFVQFGVTKGALPLCMANLSQSPVLAVFSHTGFQDAADGASHQGLMYLAMSGAIPHLQQYCPASAEEAEWAMEYAIERFAADRGAGRTPDSVLFFCGRENFPVTLRQEGQQYEWGKAMIVADTTADTKRSVVISANGSMVATAIEAAKKLAAEGIGALVLNNATPNRPDVAGHLAALQRAGGHLVTVEDHQEIAGAGSMLVTALMQAGAKFDVKVLGVKGEFGQSAYLASELYDKHGIGVSGIVAAAKGLA
jgi:transketolase